MFRRYADSILQALPANRLLAVDAFRGLAIVAMILVNNPGSWSHVYPPLLHAKWHGWTPTDLIFPFFVFIVGLSISIAVPRQLQAGKSHGELIRQGLIRATKLILLGWLLALFYVNFRDPNFSWVEDRLLSMRIPGVLQRLGLVYFATLLLVLYWQTLGRIILALLLLLGYWALLIFMPYTDEAGNSFTGLLLPGNNLVAWLDHQLFGPAHLYQQTQPFAQDPEGLLSTLPAIASCLSGVLAGQLLCRQALSLAERTRLLLMAGLAGILAAEIWQYWLPLNKALWTSSYVLLSSGYAALVLGLFLWLIDLKGIKRWCAPLVVFGANAIAFFMFAGIAGRILIMIPVGQTTLKGWLFAELFQPVFGSLNGSLAFALCFLAFSYLLMHWMYKKGWFWKV
ncbi:acyltransferase family protein [Bowmanella dokdonensis]|uniref:DUF1624 domain-containing protein n=1 Tax=Bowmanella dokdonensis TaxID=751969 RepID=A0A939IR64_9ALTE|nr:DUF5009 domain-containing protein [Bowmanella dokdonensis]MBN7825317.1 DUF1624 domain-containing protein [Bowmanella dokdonensis]